MTAIKTFRLKAAEYEALNAYAARKQRTKSDILRELLRTCEVPDDVNLAPVTAKTPSHVVSVRLRKDDLKRINNKSVSAVFRYLVLTYIPEVSDE